jgi:hypothetical protein
MLDCNMSYSVRDSHVVVLHNGFTMHVSHSPLMSLGIAAFIPACNIRSNV